MSTTPNDTSAFGRTAIDIPLEQIELDWTYYPRERLDESRILEFRELLRDLEGRGLPPVDLVRHPTKPGRFLVAEGWHRTHAHLDEGRLTIPAVILPPDTDVFLHAVQQAATTPKPLNRTEKRSAVIRILTEHPDWSNHRIADVAGVSRPFVSRLRAGGNVAPTEEVPDETGAEFVLPQRGPDPAERALRSLVKAYTDGYGRTKLGFGKAVTPKLIRRYLEELGDDAYEDALTALRAWAAVLADEAAWLPDGEA